VERRHDLRHFRTVGLDGEFLIAFEYVAHALAVDDEYRAKRRLKDLAATPDFLEHRIRFEPQEEPDDRAHCPALTNRLAFE
jgi:hypothetical protein